MNKLVEKIKSLFEKVKSLDKKVLIGAGVGLAALIIAIVVILVVSLGGKDTNNDKDDTDTKDKIEKEEKEDKDESDDESDDEEEATFLVKVVDAEGNPVAGVSIQLIKDESLTATSDDTGVATFNVEITEGYKLSGVTCPEGYEYTGEAEIALEAGAKEYTLTVQKKDGSDGEGDVQVTNPGDVNGVTQSPVTTKPDGQEIFGVGSASQPYEEIPNLDTMTVTTVAVPAGKTLYYNIQRVGGMYLTIEDADAYVITSNGTRHDAKNGKVAFTVENKMANEYVSFQIGNKGSASKTFTIKFSNLNGTQANPEKITTLSGSKSLAKGDEDGWYYKYKATQNGKIRFYINDVQKSDITVTNLRTSAVRNFAADANGNSYIEIEVNAGDELTIQVCAKPDKRWNYPAVDITWRGEYV